METDAYGDNLHRYYELEDDQDKSSDEPDVLPSRLVFCISVLLEAHAGVVKMMVIQPTKARGTLAALALKRTPAMTMPLVKAPMMVSRLMKKPATRY